MTATADRAAIAGIVGKYQQAFLAIDMDIFKAVWDRDYAGIVYVPQERAEAIRGWAALEQYFESVEKAFDKVTVMQVDNVTIDILGDVAYAYFTYHFEATTPGQDKPFTVDGRDTLIARRAKEDWQIIHYHGSAPGPY